MGSWSRLLAGALLLAAGLAGEAAPGPTSEKAVRIAYRLDRELGMVDAAQRHALVARLLLARQSGALRADVGLEELWLGWEANLEALEQATGLRRLPAWHEPSMGDAVAMAVRVQAGIREAAAGERPSLLSGPVVAGLRLVCAGGGSPVTPAVQAGVLAWSRSHAPAIWAQLLRWLEEEPEWIVLVEPLLQPTLALSLGASLSEWRALDDPITRELDALLAAPATDPLAPLRAAVDRLSDDAGAADRVFRAPGSWGDYRTFLDPPGQPAGLALASLARAADGIAGGRYAEFVSALIAVAGFRFEPGPAFDGERLLRELDRLDPVLLDYLPQVDPRLLNVYQRTRQLLRDPSAAERARGPGVAQELATLQATVTLEAADLDLYLAQPVRGPMVAQMERCLSQGSDDSGGPPVPMPRAAFETCLAGFERWALESATASELSGQRTGPYEAEQLLREARLSPWQRINYWLGYVEQELAPGCALPAEPLVNPLEWSIAARSLGVLLDRWPQYGDAGALARLLRLERAGVRTLEVLARLRACADEASPLLGTLAQYGAAADALFTAVDEAAARLRETFLEPGADVDLAAGPQQQTAYRPEERQVVPCGGVASCGMEATLEASKALYSLFPEPFLVADQVRLGQVELCYSDVSWIDRRAELPPVRSEAMARYFGRLSFVLQGRYSGMDMPVFAMRLVTPNEYEYLYGENSPEVLDDPCPRDRVDTQVHAELPRRLIELVPRRLTYMTADRTQPSRLFEANWSAGQEWRDWFVTGQGVEVLLRSDAEAILPAISQRLQAVYRRQRQELFGLLLAAETPRRDVLEEPLVLAMRSLELEKRVVAALARLLFARPVAQVGALRATLYGEEGLFDRGAVLRLQQRGVEIDELTDFAAAGLRRARTLWRSRAGSPPPRALAEADPLLAATLLELAARREAWQSVRTSRPDVVGDDQ